MLRTITAIAIAIAIAAPGAAHAAKKKKAGPAAQPCVSASSMPSLDVYTLKTEFMTAALSCGPDARQRYNQFVTLRESELISHSATMKKALGKRTNSFVTKVANDTGGQLNCEEASGHFDRVLPPSTESLDSVATTEWAQPRHGYKVCSSKPNSKNK